MARLHIPGVSIAVINDLQLDWAAGYGVRESGTNDPVTADTLFQAASISKPVAVSAVLRLVDQGILNLDEDVNRYLRSWKVPANGSWQPRVTLRRLMSHTAGTTVEGFPGYTRGTPIPTTVQVLNGESPANTAPIRVNWLPGSQYRYSGGGFTIMQQLLTDVTGTPFAELMRSLVLEPLGMTSSTYEQPLPQALWGRAASGHNWGPEEPVTAHWHVYPEQAAAGLWTTPSDLAKFLIALQRSLAGDAKALLRRETAADMLRLQGNPEMGLGLRLRGAGNPMRFYHSGSNAGFKNRFTGYCHLGFGAIIMTNSDNGGILADELLAAIATEYAWPDYHPAEPSTQDLPQELARAVEGEYLMPGSVRVVVAANGGAVVLRSPDQPDLELEYIGEMTFRASVIDLELAFAAPAGAQHAASVMIRQDGQTFDAARRT